MKEWLRNAWQGLAVRGHMRRPGGGMTNPKLVLLISFSPRHAPRERRALADGALSGKVIVLHPLLIRDRSDQSQ